MIYRPEEDNLQYDKYNRKWKLEFFSNENDPASGVCPELKLGHEVIVSALILLTCYLNAFENQSDDSPTLENKR